MASQQKQGDGRIDRHEEDLRDNLVECVRVLGVGAEGTQGNPFILYVQPLKASKGSSWKGSEKQEPGAVEQA